MATEQYDLKFVSDHAHMTSFRSLYCQPGDHSVVPKPNDDEVDHFECLTANQVVDEMVAGNFKPNCALV